MKLKITYLVSHPIQYQAPLSRKIASLPWVDLTVCFMSDFSMREYKDSGFGRSVAWDVPLTDGYCHRFLKPYSHSSKFTILTPLNYEIVSLLKKDRCDILWTHGYHQATLVLAILAARREGIKVFLHSENQRTAVIRRGGILSSVKEAAISWLFKKVDMFLPIGTLNREYYSSFGVPQEKMALMPYAVDNERFIAQSQIPKDQCEALKASLGLNAAAPVILYAASFLERKRAIDLLEAYVLAYPQFSDPKPSLIFVGDGEERSRVQERAEGSGFSSIVFPGFANQQELPKYLALADLFVLPSRQEQWGLVVNEVMCAGAAVIVTDEVGCGPDLVENGANGYIYPAGDVHQLSEALVAAFVDRDALARMGDASLSKIKNWSFDEDAAGLKLAAEKAFLTAIE